MEQPIALAADTQAVHRPTHRSVQRREVRGFYATLTALMIGLVIAGFWPYFNAIGRDTVVRPLLVHVHGAVFCGWMLLLALQVALVQQRRTDLHRRLGSWGIAYGWAVFVMGIVATIVAPVAHVARGEWTIDQAASFLILPIGDMALFGGLFWAAIAARRRPQEHKRYIVLATIALLFAPAARLMEFAGAGGILAVWLFPLLIAAAYDLWLLGRVHRTYLAGSAVLVCGFSRIFVMEHDWWLRIGRILIRAAMPLAPILS